jgi:hypothetical protein
MRSDNQINKIKYLALRSASTLLYPRVRVLFDTNYVAKTGVINNDHMITRRRRQLADVIPSAQHKYTFEKRVRTSQRAC